MRETIPSRASASLFGLNFLHLNRQLGMKKEHKFNASKLSLQGKQIHVGHRIEVEVRTKTIHSKTVACYFYRGFTLHCACFFLKVLKFIGRYLDVFLLKFQVIESGFGL